jgi:hypothetical protein
LDNLDQQDTPFEAQFDSIESNSNSVFNTPTKSRFPVFHSIKKSFNRIKFDNRGAITAPIQLLNADEPSIIKRKYFNLRSQTMLRFEMPSLLEQNEQLNGNVCLTNETCDELKAINTSISQAQTPTLATNPTTTALVSSQTNLTNDPSSANNLLTSLEYLINSKSGLINTKQVIANIAAAAANPNVSGSIAQCNGDAHDSNVHIGTCGGNLNAINMTNNENGTLMNSSNNNNNSSSNECSSINEYFLHSLFMDLVPASASNQAWVNGTSRIFC